MPKALVMLFDDLFKKQRVDSIRASCFATNTRCLRVLEKLRFQPDRLGLLDRIGHIIAARAVSQNQALSIDGRAMEPGTIGEKRLNTDVSSFILPPSSLLPASLQPVLFHFAAEPFVEELLLGPPPVVEDQR